MDDRSLVLESLISELKNNLSKNWHFSLILPSKGQTWKVGSWVKIDKNFRERGDLEVPFHHVGCLKGSACSGASSSSTSEKNVDTRCRYEDNHEWVSRSIMKESESWLMKIKECSVNCGKIVIKLKREDVFKEVLRSVHSRGLDYGTQDNCGEVVLLSTDHIPEDCDLSLLRLAFTTKVSRRILEKLGYSVCDGPTATECLLKVHFTVNPSVRGPNVSVFVCGVVRNMLTHKKEVNIRADSYRRMREKDVEQASVHKYGPSVLQPSWKTFLDAVTESVVTVDLLCTKPSQPVSLDMQEKFVLNRERSSKGATFLLYNYARLVSILTQFDEKVSKGIYPPLVPIENADFSLLSSEEEWMLAYCYLMPYPSLLAQLVKPKELKFDIHMLLKYMQDLCKCLSAYYSRVHILTEPRKHLLPLMYSRLHLISGIKIMMQSIFTLFNIIPVSQM